MNKKTGVIKPNPLINYPKLMYKNDPNIL